MTPKKHIWRHAPLPLLKFAVARFGSFQAKERLCLVNRAWYAYGLLSAAQQARKLGLKEMQALEFGVAAGRGLRNLSRLALEVTAVTGVKIHLVGFDTGAGMPEITDYRDHPENYQAGDFPMLDQEKLRRDIGDEAELHIGDLKDTIPEYFKTLDRSAPIGFFAMDVDIYSSSMSALKLFEGGAECYLPFVFAYFDDSSSRSHFNRFCGELLAIEHFNQLHELRKIDIDRGAWNAHREVGPQLWFERMFILHVFDHSGRFPSKTRGRKIISET